MTAGNQQLTKAKPAKSDPVTLTVKRSQVRPEDGETHNNLGMILFQEGRVAEAISHLEQAVRLRPEYAQGHHTLGKALALAGRVPEAIGHLEQALRLQPNAFTHFELGKIRLEQGTMPEAVAHYRKALELDPQMVSALNDLAWILTTETNGAIRSVDEAVRRAEQACELTTNTMASYLDTLGVAYSESGRFNDAVQASQRAAALARAAGNTKLAARIESRLEHYREGRPYHTISKATRP